MGYADAGGYLPGGCLVRTLRAGPRLRAWMRKHRKPAPSPAPKTPLPDNPYHRCFTQNRSFEELVRPAPAKDPPPVPGKS